MLLSPHRIIFFHDINGKCSRNHSYFSNRDCENYRLRSLRGNTYLELGTGLENIFKFFRIDFVWRFAPQPVVPAGMVNPNPTPNPAVPTPIPVTNFGVFGSFQFKL